MRINRRNEQEQHGSDTFEVPTVQGGIPFTEVTHFCAVRLRVVGFPYKAESGRVHFL